MLIPLLFMGDVVGRLFREFAITLAVTILISAVVSLTLVPMVCAKLLRRPAETKESAASQRWSRERFDALIARLRPRAHLGARPPGADAPGRGRRRWRSPPSSTSSIPKGFFPAPGHRPDPGHLRGVADRSPTPRWRSGSRRSPPRSSRIPMSTACRRSSASTAPTRRSTAAAS